MSPADGIAKLGFRRWYERQLIESHAYLLTGILCAIVIAVALEGVNLRAAGAATLIALVATFAAGALGFESFKRYLAVLDRAERIAAHAVCTSCSTYGRLEVLAAGGEPRAGERPESLWMRVACRKCGHRWLID